MDKNIGCYNGEANILLAISNASLSYGNGKCTNDSVRGLFPSLPYVWKLICPIYQYESFQIHFVNSIKKRKKKTGESKVRL